MAATVLQISKHLFPSVTVSKFSKRLMGQVSDHQKNLMARGLPKKRSLPGVKHVVLVASGKGGVGKSTTSVNLAVALSMLQEKLSIGIFDADVFGPSIPIMMNLNEKPLLSDTNMMIPPVNFGIKCMSMGFLVNPDDSIVWRGPMVMGALEKILHGTAWDPLDILIVDLPPGTGDVHLTIAQTLSVSGAIIVSTPQRVALADATKAEKMFQLVKIPVLGLVENMASFVCLNCHEKSNLFGNESQEWAKKLNIPLLGSVPLERLVMEGADSGAPITLMHPNSVSSMAYFEIARNLIQELSVPRP